MMKNPEAVKFLESIHSDARREAVYDVVAAMAQAQQGIDLAEKNGNAMAFIKGCELRSKLSGLLVDKVEVVTVDLTRALAQAEVRVLSVMHGTPPLLTDNGARPTGTDPRISIPGPGRPGDPFAE